MLSRVFSVAFPHQFMSSFAASYPLSVLSRSCTVRVAICNLSSTKRVPWPRLLFLIASLLGFFPWAARAEEGASAAAQTPVNQNASPEARALLKFFYEIGGKYTLTGQHNTPSQINYWSQRAYDLTGKYPAVFGQDLGFAGGSDKDSALARAALLEEIKVQHQRGAVITLTWHAVCPTDDEPVTFRDSVQHKLSDFEWEEVITPGTRLNERWRVQVDEIAGFLRQLRDAHIPVLWRPYHEVHGGWFWWGGRVGPRGSSALYRMMFDRYVNQHHLDNLIWVWNGGIPNEKDPQGTNYYPGSEYADILSTDVYGPFSPTAYEQFLQVAHGKPIALGEVGVPPSAEVLRTQPRWTYFMIWSEFIDFSNPIAPLKTVFDDPRQLSRGDPQLDQAMIALRALRAPAAAAPPVTPGATESAQALLAKLYAISGKQSLSGIDFRNAAQPYTPASFAETFQRRPAIYAADLAAPPAQGTTPAAALNALIDEATREAKAGAILSLSWRAPRPSDPEDVAPDQSARAALSDFEWRELLTPGTRLHERWLAQVDRLATSLQVLRKAGIPVLWRPYPEINVKKYWWGGRRGAAGAPALYRMLFERLSTHHRLNNLIWVWTAAPDAYSEVPGAQFHDFLPGHLYFDSIALSIEPTGQRGGRRPPMDRVLAHAGGGKPIGIELSAAMLRPETFTREPGLAWFVVTSFAPPPAPGSFANSSPSTTTPGAAASLPGTAPTPWAPGTGAPPNAPTAMPPTAAATSTPTPPPATASGGAPAPVDPVATFRAALASPQVISAPTGG